MLVVVAVVITVKGRESESERVSERGHTLVQIGTFVRPILYVN